MFKYLFLIVVFTTLGNPVLLLSCIGAMLLVLLAWTNVHLHWRYARRHAH